MKSLCLILAILVLAAPGATLAAPKWETRHYETTDNGFLDASAPDSLTGWLCGVRDQVGGILYQTTDGGTNWQEFRPWTVQQCMFTFGIQFPNPNTGYVTAMGIILSLFPAGALYKTTDGGASWTLAYGLTSGFIGILWDDVFFADANNGWLAGPRSDIRRTTNGGTAWTRQTAPDTGYSLKSIHFINPSEGWIVGGDYDSLTGRGEKGVILHTTNGGANWTAQLQNEPAQLWGVHALDNQNVWVCGYRDSASPGIFYRTTNGGGTWSQITAPSVSLGPYGLYAVDFPEPQFGFAAGGGSRWNTQGSYFAAFLKTTDGGGTWAVDTVIFDNSPWGFSPLGMDMYSKTRGYAGGARLSAFRYSDQGTQGVEIVHETRRDPDALPRIIPFARGFKILFLPDMKVASLSVYDVLGRKVMERTLNGSTLICNVPSAGNYFILFKGESGESQGVKKVTVF